MAARSTGIFSREGFNLDNENIIIEWASGTPGSGAPAAKVALDNAKTIRVIVPFVQFTGPTGDGVAARFRIYVGGQLLEITKDNLDGYVVTQEGAASTPEIGHGTYIAHVRGALCSDNQLFRYETAGTDGNNGAKGEVAVSDAYIELVDGPRR